ncbi:MAG: PHP domain-containing protein [Clostridia bacterium]|nr:PHP domain-containing protein [Clostridia bacterium]
MIKRYKVEGHLHVKGNSWCGKTDASDIIKLYNENHYDGIIVTNHFNRHIYQNYFKAEDREGKLQEFFKSYNELKNNTEGIKVYFAVEFALQDDHYNFIFKKDCAEMLVYGITPEEFIEYGTDIIDMDYKGLKELSNKMGWIVCQAHPYRESTKLIDVDCIDGLEVFNGNPRHVNRNRKALKRAEKYGLIQTVGSDFHQAHDISSAFVFEEMPQDEKDLVRVLKSGHYDTLKGKRALRRFDRKRKY